MAHSVKWQAISIQFAAEEMIIFTLRLNVQTGSGAI
jgi:hypothetical protein